MSETLEALASDTEAPAPEPVDDLRAAIGAAFDEVAGASEADETGQERDASGRFVARERETSGVNDHETPDGERQEQEATTDGKEAAEEARAEVPPQPVKTPVDEVLEQYKPLYAARGIPVQQAVGMLFEAQKLLEERPVEAIAVLARQYGVDLTKFGAQPQQAEQPTNDATQAALQRVQQLEQRIQAYEQQQEQSRRAEIEQSIAAFAADPKHSHFPTVRKAMGALMQAGEAKDMADAYDQACRANPTVWASIQKAEAEARAKSDAEAKQKAAEEARRRNVQRRGSSPVNGFAKAPESLRDTIEAAWDGRLN